MSSTQTNDEGVMQAILKSANASNAMAIANTFYVKVKEDINNSVDKLRQAQTMAMNTALDFSYKIARTVLMQSLIEASLNLGSAVGSYSALSSASSEQSTFNKLQTKESPNLEKLKTRETDLNKELDKVGTTKARKTEIKGELKDIKNDRGTINSKLKKLQKKADQKMQKANTIANTMSTASQGLNAVPKAMSDSTNTIGQAVKSVMDQLQSMLSSSYDKLMQTLKGFLDINYLAGLVALGSMQLR